MRRSLFSRVGLAALIVFLANPAFAVVTGDGVLDDVTQRFLTQSVTWATTITRAASWLFWTLVMINMIMTFGKLALEKADIGNFFSVFIRFTLVTGFFWWLLSNGPAMGMAIINSMREIGATAAGLPNTLTPSTPIAIAFDIVKKAFAGFSYIHPIDNLAIVVVCIVIVLSLTVVAANVLVALVTAWTMAYAGIFLLGFGGCQWTSEMAISYFKAMLGVGLELMVVTLLVGVATSVVDGLFQNLTEITVYQLLVVLTVCGTLALIIHMIPARMGGLVGGGSGANATIGSVVGAAALATAAAATATAAAAGIMSGAGGGAQALMAAFNKANASESSGGSGAADLMAAVGGGGGGGGGGGADIGGSGGSGGGGGSALAAAMGNDSGSRAASASGGASQSSAAGQPPKSDAPGEVKSGGAIAAAGAMAAKAGRVAVGTAANLAQGSWDVGMAKLGDLKDSALERMADTTGGRIAAAINARAAANEHPPNSSADFTDNSLSGAASVTPDYDAEIAAFRDRKSNQS